MDRLLDPQAGGVRGAHLRLGAVGGGSDEQSLRDTDRATALGLPGWSPRYPFEPDFQHRPACRAGRSRRAEWERTRARRRRRWRRRRRREWVRWWWRARPRW